LKFQVSRESISGYSISNSQLVTFERTAKELRLNLIGTLAFSTRKILAKFISNIAYIFDKRIALSSEMFG
jgi:hypothetical protein